jgi:hypothetical protein
LPVAVFLNLLAADLLVFILGIYALLFLDPVTAVGCFPFLLVTHAANRAPILAAQAAVLLGFLEKHLEGCTGFILDQDFIFIVTQES